MSPHSMPSTDVTSRSPRVFGPIQILDASLGRQLLGYVLAAIGFVIFVWLLNHPLPLVPAVIHIVIAANAVLNGLYLGGVRLR